MRLQRLHPVLLVFIGAIALIWPCFYNGFPLVYSDTGTYLESGFILDTPLDRPITYGLLIRVFSLNGLTLWTVPFFQSCILSLVLFWTVGCIGPKQWHKPIFASAIFILAAFTGLPLVCSDLIADVFTSISILAIYLLLFHRHSKGKTIALYIILLFAAACHISHILILAGIIGVTGLFRIVQHFRNKQGSFPNRHLYLSVLILLLAFTTMMSSISKSRHVFMMGHLVETGILDAYLDDHCGKDSISLCNFRNQIPDGAETFIWNSNGNNVLMNTGGWMGSKEEYSKIISETFSDTRYLSMHVRAAAEGTLRQLISVRVSEGMGRYDSAQLVTQRVNKYFSHEFAAYSASRQSADEFEGTPVIDSINRTALLIAALLFITGMIVLRNPSLRTLGFVTIGAYVLNCMICATFATVAHRFGTRLSWMFVLFAVLFVADVLFSKKNEAGINN